MSAYDVLIGHKVHRLMVMSVTDRRDRWGQPLLECRCECGTTTFVRGEILKNGRQKSCGCILHDREHATSHGCARQSGPTPEYRAWIEMRRRCSNRSLANFHRYGGRGIRVCDRWATSFETFLADMGPRPSAKHSIDRINNDGNYEPGNCRWATTGEQAANKSVTVAFVDLDDKKVALSQVAHRIAMHPSMLRRLFIRSGVTSPPALAERAGLTVQVVIVAPRRKR